MANQKNHHLTDMSDDLLDLGVLVDQLYDFESSADRSVSVEYHDDLADKLVESFENNIKAINEKRLQLANSIEAANELDDETTLLEIVENLRKEYLSLKAAVRVAHRQKGALSLNLANADHERISFEPAQSTAVAFETGNMRAEQNRGLAPLFYEGAFLDAYASHLGSDKLEAYVVNSGMSAFSTIINVLTARLDPERSVVGLQPMYYENFHLLQRFFPKAKLPELATNKELLNYLSMEQPSAIFFDAASNHGETLVHDVESLVEWARKNATLPTVLIIDTTCLPSVILPSGLLNAIPPHVCVFIIESLAKHHQFGMDIITGGILLLHGDEAFHCAVQTARATFGTEISEASAATLPKPNTKLLTRRMQRHSRNIALLATMLGEKIVDQKGVIESVTWLTQGVGPGWYKTSALNLRFQREHRTLDKYREFEYKVLEIAKLRGHRLALGSSFGFDITRLFMTTPGTSCADPFLRLSIGTETQHEIERFAEIIIQAHKELLGTWQSSSVSKQH